MRLLVVAVVSVLLLPATTGRNRIDGNPQYLVESPAIYSPNPNHIWNRVYDVLLVRTDEAGATTAWIHSTYCCGRRQSNCWRDLLTSKLSVLTSFCVPMQKMKFAIR